MIRKSYENVCFSNFKQTCKTGTVLKPEQHSRKSSFSLYKAMYFHTALQNRGKCQKVFCHFYYCCNLNNHPYSKPAGLHPQSCMCTTFSFEFSLPTPHLVAVIKAGNTIQYYHSFHFGTLLITQGSCNPCCYGRPTLSSMANH